MPHPLIERIDRAATQCDAAPNRVVVHPLDLADYLATESAWRQAQDLPPRTGPFTGYVLPTGHIVALEADEALNRGEVRLTFALSPNAPVLHFWQAECGSAYQHA